ncbi:hypothetical protein AB0I94_02305 [Streptomyces sp. NPDC050147]|uniref:hypothetical protein n=1 Tax=Streptomyces sp. NPDC050147 TaxID=3155513 RepID=UPI0034408BBA
MPELIDRHQADEALHQALTRPTLAEQLLLAVAGHLAAHAPTDQLTGIDWSRALCASTISTLRGVPEAVANRAAATAVLSLPPMDEGITRGEYALRLHAAAKGL